MPQTIGWYVVFVLVMLFLAWYWVACLGALASQSLPARSAPRAGSLRRLSYTCSPRSGPRSAAWPREKWPRFPATPAPLPRSARRQQLIFRRTRPRCSRSGLPGAAASLPKMSVLFASSQVSGFGGTMYALEYRWLLALLPLPLLVWLFLPRYKRGAAIRSNPIFRSGSQQLPV